MAGRLRFLWAPTRLVSDDPAKGIGRAEREDLLFPRLRRILGEPRERLGLVSAYFVPGRAGAAAFGDMAKRGVEVTILTNALEATDVPIVHSGYAKRRKPLLAAGVRLYEMRRPPDEARAGGSGKGSGAGSPGSRLRGVSSALHAKTFAVDRQRVFVGSFNFDPRSANLNCELGLVIDSHALAERLHDTFERLAPAKTYEVRLSPEGKLYWLEPGEGKEARYDTEPGTSRWQRAAVAVLSRLPIEWLL